MLYQGPKQHKGLKFRKKTFGFSIKKGGGLNPLRVHKEGPKSMDGQALDLTKQRKEKSPIQPSKVRNITGEPGEKIGPEYLGIPWSLGSSGCAVRPGWD